MTTDNRRTLVVPLSDVEWRDAGDPERKGETTLRGHAAVFNSLSEDLGGFRELIEPGFFRGALQRNPDVRLLINHEDLPLARTKSGTLELREDPRGLHVFARLDKTDPDVVRLRGKMQRGDVDQMSFAFTMREDGDDWDVTDDGSVVRTLRADGADELFDVSVVTFPAYRQTDVSMRSVLQDAISRGRVPVTVEQAESLASDEERDAVADSVTIKSGSWIAPNSSWVNPIVGSTSPITVTFTGSTEVAPAEPEGEERDAAPETADAPADNELLPEFQRLTRETRDELQESYLRLLKEHGLA